MANFAPKATHALFWVDFETTSLPKEGNEIIDFSDVHVLEVAVIITDFDLNPISGYEEVVKMTPAALNALRNNPVVVEMPKANGLIRDSRAASMSLGDVEAELVKLIHDTTTFDKQEFMIAGSGVAAFDHPLIKAKMPLLAKYLAYFPFDIGVVRRNAKILARQPVVNPTIASYGDSKEHRAMADVRAHIKESESFRDFYQQALEAIAEKEEREALNGN